MGTHSVANYEKDKSLRITLRVSLYSEKTLGQKLRKRRKELGLKQTELAQMLGVNKTTVMYWENGLKTPRRENMKKVRRFLSDQLEATSPEETTAVST